MLYRQIHLDFHTSPVIGDVGTEFDASDFVSALTGARVDSINIFAKCHHGMCYYPTTVGKMHPSLKFDLMGEMIGALHENGIRCPIYFPLGWEEDAAEHTDWLEIGRDGIPGHKRHDDASYYSWRKLCLNNREYKEYIKAQLTEIIENYEVDGFWFDIISQNRCLCPECLEEMRVMGLDPGSDRDVMTHDDYVLEKLQRELNGFITSFGKDIPAFFNSSWLPNSGYDGLEIEHRSRLQDHIELESLPSGEWGYNHFPLLVNYHNRNGGEIAGMTGKFHISWGDHGSLKNDEALEYECFRMLANGCACCVGDQLHPRGRMNKAAYERIGRVFREIEKLEPYCDGSSKITDIGVIVSTGFFDRNTASDEGVMRMLSELHYTYDFIPVTEGLDRYRLVILPDRIRIDESLSGKLKSYIQNGGRVIATYKSTDEDSLGIEYLCESEYEPAYMVIGDGLIRGVEGMEYVCYLKGAYVRSSLPVIARVGVPYFNRTAECFSSHRHFPFDRVTEHPAAALSDSVGYCAFPLFEDYITNGNRIYRDVIGYMIETLLKDPSIRVTAPSCAEVTARTRSGKTYVHILSYIPERRTRTIDIVDTRLPIMNVDASVPESSGYKSAVCLRSGEHIALSHGDDGYLHAVIPEIDGYECVEFT